MKIIGKATGEIEVKRFYIPGIKVVGECPSCNAQYIKDFADEYLSYPLVGAPDFMHFYCNICDHEWGKQAILDIKIKFIED